MRHGPATAVLISLVAALGSLGSARTSMAAARPLYRDAVAVLTFHEISPRLMPGTDSITPAVFAGDIAALRRGGYHFVSLAQLERFVSGKGRVPPQAVTVVFDNGYEGIDRYAYPLLRREHIPATVFLIVRYVGRLRNDFTWKQVEALSRHGIRFETETYDLHRAVAVPGGTAPATVGRILYPGGRRESRAAWARRVLADLVRARRTVAARTHQPVNALVDPYGQYDPSFLALVRRAGYRYAFSTLGWLVEPHTDPLRLERLDVGVWNVTPQDLLAQIATVAADAARDPGYRPPSSVLTVWR